MLGWDEGQGHGMKGKEGKCGGGQQQWGKPHNEGPFMQQRTAAIVEHYISY
jgi:hypothetical protein